MTAPPATEAAPPAPSCPAPAAAPGAAIPSHRRLWALAGPLILANLTVPLLGVVDTAIVGHLEGVHHLGAVAAGALVFNVVFWGLGFLRMGTSALAAQAFGAGAADGLRAVLARALLVAAGLGVLVLVLQGPLIWWVLPLIGGSAWVQEEAAVYVGIRIWSAPATLANFALVGWLVGVQRTRSVFVVQLVTNGVNTAGSLIFALGFGWGLAGVAAGTVLGEAAGLAAGLMAARHGLGQAPGRLPAGALTDPAAYRRLLVVNRDILIRTLCLVAGFAWFTRQGAAAGDVTMAANAVLMQLVMLAAHALDAFAHVAEALVGAAIGARAPAALRAAVIRTTQWAAAAALLLALAWLLGGGLLIDALTDLPQVRAEARLGLPFAALLPLVAVWAWQLDGIFIGATATVAMRNAMILSLALYVALSLPLAAGGIAGIWMAFLGFQALRALTLLVHGRAVWRAAG